MKTVNFFLILPLIVLSFSCKKINTDCMKGTVIGKIRSDGGGLAVSLDKNYKGSVNWKDEKNVIELLNIPDEWKTPGTVIYFSSRKATASEQGAITADGDESIQLVLYGLEIRDNGCP
jgi:hypothetical protein